jgi:ERCC4-type nuclease
LQLYLLQGLPGVGPLIAKRLLKRFQSAANVFNAGVNDLITVKGIGHDKAEHIRAVLDSRWCR